VSKVTVWERTPRWGDSSDEAIGHPVSPDMEERPPVLHVVVDTSGDGRYVTTDHPLSLATAQRLFPGRVRVVTKEPRLSDYALRDGSPRGVIQETCVEILFSRQHGQNSVGPYKTWQEVDSRTTEVSDELADAVRQTAKEKREAAEAARAVIVQRVDGLVSILTQVRDASKQHRTAAEDRIRILGDLRTLRRGFRTITPEDASAELDDHTRRVETLARQTARETGWPLDWAEQYNRFWTGTPEAVTQHAFAQECIAAGTVTADVVVNGVRHLLATRELARIQCGEVLDINALIDEVLEAMV
jgi:hypothetical protein